MLELPAFIPYIFVAITIATLLFIIAAVDKATPKKTNFTATIVGTAIILWLFLIALGAFYGFFEDYEARPPRLFLLFAVNTLVMIVLFSIKRSRALIQKLPITILTFIHIIRIPVEMVLWWLANEGMLDHKLTFEGSNFDILIGITAPFAAIFMLGLKSKSRFAAIIWNIVGILMLANIVIMAIRASPYFYDPALFGKPNIAVFYFPFIWLPGFVVPAVLFSHITSLYQLFTDTRED
ncbi:MAG: hypothetical protein R8G66_04855 [Cytophagales bacterium]|nr:hypothetical protein [Cytophagales bacterium]